MLDQTCNATHAKNAQYQNVDKSVFVMLLLFFFLLQNQRDCLTYWKTQMS